MEAATGGVLCSALYSMLLIDKYDISCNMREKYNIQIAEHNTVKIFPANQIADI